MNAGIKAINATIINAIMNGNAQIKRNIAMKNRIIVSNVDMFVLLVFVLVFVLYSKIYICNIKIFTSILTVFKKKYEKS